MSRRNEDETPSTPLTRMRANYLVLAREVSSSMSVVLGAIAHMSPELREKITEAVLAYGEAESRRRNLAEKIRATDAAGWGE